MALDLARKLDPVSTSELLRETASIWQILALTDDHRLNLRHHPANLRYEGQEPVYPFVREQPTGKSELILFHRPRRKQGCIGEARRHNGDRLLRPAVNLSQSSSRELANGHSIAAAKRERFARECQSPQDRTQITTPILN